ncbi:MAG: hypothetical protein IPH85_10430 [Ignavibacteria bacterium]|nr:hypothetical protein [Ignavibacteria bacterium]
MYTTRLFDFLLIAPMAQLSQSAPRADGQHAVMLYNCDEGRCEVTK